MVLTVFRSRLRPDLNDDDLARYQIELAEMRRLAEASPGFVSVKAFTADDGERVTLVRFDSEEHQRAWARNPHHVEAQRRGRDRYYAWYELGVYSEGRERRWTADER